MTYTCASLTVGVISCVALAFSVKFVVDNVIVAVAPGPAVAVNVGAGSVPDVAVSVLGPSALPSVHVVRATPDASVVDVVGFTEPPPDVTVHVTVAPDTGLPN